MTTQTKAHGLDGTLVEPDWPPLTLDEVRRVLSRFSEISEAIRIASVSPRPFSSAGVIATRNKPVFIKRHHRAVRDAAGLHEEHQFISHLREHGAPVPHVYSNADGETAIESGEWTYEVHEIPCGIDLYEHALSWTPFRSVEHAGSAGETLARLHLAAAEYDAPARKPRPLVTSFIIFAAKNPSDALDSYLAARPALRSDPSTRRDCVDALNLLAPFHAELAPLLSALPSVWTHNDLHASNLFWSGTDDTAHATAAIDFGLADRTNAIYDLAQLIERNIVEWLALSRSPQQDSDTPVHLDHLIAVLVGYESIRPLTTSEAAALAPMMALCHAEFALTEADYFLGVLRSPEKARIASHDYLVGHAQWFRSPAGATLLRSLREWAVTREMRAGQR